MQTFNIKVPIWGGRKVGLAVHKIEDDNLVNILVQDKDGKRLYPKTYYISGDKAHTYPLQDVKNTAVTLHVIPINELEIYEEKGDEIVGRLVLFSGQEYEITHTQHEKISKLLNDPNITSINVAGVGDVKKSNIALNEGDEPDNPFNIDRSPEAVAKRQMQMRRKIERQAKDLHEPS